MNKAVLAMAFAFSGCLLYAQAAGGAPFAVRPDVPANAGDAERNATVALVAVTVGPALLLPFLVLFVPWYRKRSSRRRLPGIAEALGLRNYESRVIGSGGTWGGTIRDRSVWLDPDKGKIKVWLRRDFSMTLDPQQPVLKPDEGWMTFVSASPVLNQLFLTRYAALSLAPVFVVASPELERLSTALSSFHRGRLRIARNTLEYSPLRARHPDFIPVKDLRHRIDALAELAEAFDVLLPAPAQERLRYRPCPQCGAACVRDVDGKRFGSCPECHS